ncbi:hypothetical protein SDC9_211647 [bioreactor metagenome]|uniref:Uncharacterized protein n=1 Tax=bioreactor metagenome TaxID=1076179 RepID=A0A645JL94_9ZZZZ
MADLPVLRPGEGAEAPARHISQKPDCFLQKVRPGIHREYRRVPVPVSYIDQRLSQYHRGTVCVGSGAFILPGGDSPWP